VNDQYQSVFPPDVNAVFDHGKRAVSSFPIATGTYYKMDYSAGVDISNYRNIYVPTSYMAVNSKYDFEGGYENDTHGGMLHVASHHYSPGKKQWTWGNGEFGRAWDRNLTDDVRSMTASTVPGGFPAESLRSGFRPYIELMAGVYTENQPDFAWLMPYEEKQFTQYFMPYREVGIVKQASKDFILNIEETADGVRFIVLATSRKEVTIRLTDHDGHVYYDCHHTLSPEEVLTQTVECKRVPLARLVLSVGNLRWTAEPDDIRPIPDAAEAALSPHETKTVDQLYLTGLHLEQYRHATWSALDYYEEALRRDPNDVRCLNQTGLWYLRRGRFDKAETFLRKAVRIWQKRNPNPYDGEPLFNLALTLKYQHRPQEAYELFWKSTWNKAWADAGYYEAACVSVSQRRYHDALDELDRALVFNACNHTARALKAAVLRLLGCSEDALAWIRDSYMLDPFNYGCMYEEYLLTNSQDVLDNMKQLMHRSANNYDEIALDYAAAGLQQEAHAMWDIAISEGAASPMTYYYLGRFNEAEQADSYCCFPNRLEDIFTLEVAKALNPDGARAPYYLGCLYYDKRQYDVSIENWERSAELDPKFPTIWRNLALARFNKQNRRQEALEYMERAFHLDETDARMLMELDQLYKRLHRPHAERLAFLQQYPQLIAQRDDLVLEEITLFNQLGRYEEAMQKLDAHQFHPWEGGEGKVPAQYQICRVEQAKRLLAKNAEKTERAENTEKARQLLVECLVYPPHLGEGKLYGAQDNDILYFLGRYEEGTAGSTEPAAAMYYNDAKPDKIFYAGLCYRKLGHENQACSLFHKLINYGKQHFFDHVTMDYFAVSLPDLLIWDGDLDQQNRIHCLYMLALGYLGLGDTEHAIKYLAEVEGLDNNHQGILQLRTLMETELY
jgi:tetratricopeptide (TPR) repeat protein